MLGTPKALTVGLCLPLAACAADPSADVAIRGTTVVDVTSGLLLPDQTILIAGNRIAVVGPTEKVTVPNRAQLIDGEGTYLIPGLWDMHVHSVRNGAADGVTDPQPVDWHFPLFLAYGITGVRNMNDATGDVTLALVRSVRQRMAAGDLQGPPRLLAAGPSVDGDPPFGTNSIVVRTAAEARAVVDQLADAGADFIKPYENLSREAYFAILDQAQRRGIPVDGHVPFRVTPEEAAAAGQRTIEHPDELAAACSADAETVRARFARMLSDYNSLPASEKFLFQFRLTRSFADTQDPTACVSTIDALLRYKVAVAPDLVAYYNVVHADTVLADTITTRLVPEAVRRNWQVVVADPTTREFQAILRPILSLELANVRLFNDAGVVILAATDVGVPLQIPGISLHHSLQRLTQAGLTSLEVLQAATINPARVLSLADSLGTVEAGKLADLVLLGANPLEDITNTQRIHSVIADGRVYRRQDLDRLLLTRNQN